MGFNPLSRLLQRLQVDADGTDDAVADGGAVTADSSTSAAGGADQSDTADGTVTPPTPQADTEQDAQTVVDVDLPTGDSARMVVDADVDPSAIGDVVEANAGSYSVQGQADDGTVIPVSTQDDELDLSDTFFDDETFEFDLLRDDRIQDVRDKQIDYNQRVGRWIMHKDDLVPSIKERLKGLLLGESGVQVEEDDPDNDADQRLKDHLEEIYSGQSDVAPAVDPADVVDDILDQNFMNARWVGRATDLRMLDLESLELVVDGESGDKIYVQEAEDYTTFTVDSDDPNDAVDFDVERSEPQALEVGMDVFDAQLYDRPPLEAVADDVVGKMEMKFLKARKAQIGSVGGLFIRVTPPEYLPSDEYFDRVDNPFTDDADDSITKLEKELQQGIDRAFDTLQNYKSGTVMAIPNNWEVDQIELPDSPQPLDDQIRGYNQSIARRLLLPLDLVELQSGPELSRETMFRLVLNTLQGWREEILTVFDDFADVQTEIHDLQGDVSHTFAAFANEDEELLVNALQFAGPAGMTESEIRQTLNSLEGFDLDTDRDTQNMPPAGGPTDPQERQDSMDDILPDDGDQQPPGDGSGNGGQQPDSFTSGPGSDPSDPSGQQTQAAYTPPEGLDMRELDGWDQSSVWEAFLSLGGQQSTCSTRMAGELRNPDAFCAALKDEALGTDLWRQGSGAAPDDGLQRTAASAAYVQAATVQTTASLSEVADALQDAADSDLTTLQEEDDYVAVSPGAGDPEADSFRPWVVVDSGDGEYDTSGVPDDVVSDMADALPDADGGADDDGDDAEGGSGNAQGADGGDGLLSHVPNVPDAPDTLTRAMLQEVVRWKAGQAAEDTDGLTVSVGQQYDGEASRAAEAGSEFTRHFNPSLHPRDPTDGQFVERPFDFDLDQRTLDNTPTPDLLQFLKDEGEPVDQWIAGDDMSIDGIPDDAESLDDARQTLQSDPDVNERELGVRIETPDEGNVGGTDLPDRFDQIADDVIQSQDYTQTGLSANKATETMYGARAGDSPSQDSAEFTVLTEEMATALQRELGDHPELDQTRVYNAIDDLNSLKGKSYTGKGRTWEVALDRAGADLPGDPRNNDLTTRPRADDEDYQDAVAAVAALSQQVTQKLHGDDSDDDSFTLYRGVRDYGGAQVARGFLQSDPSAGNEFVFSENQMANYTPAENVAESFRTTVHIERDVTANDVAHASDNLLGSKSSFRSEGEIALSTGATEAAYDQIYIDSSAGAEDLTIADVVEGGVEDMSVAELGNLKALLEALQKSDRVDQPGQSEVPDTMQDFLENYVTRMSESSILRLGRDAKAVLREALGNDAFNAAVEDAAGD